MPVGIPAAIMLAGGMAAVGTVAGGAISSAGQQAANEENVNAAREATQSNISEAQKQMDFQERMSSTAHQREVADLNKAGLNPILSANSGASTPSGAAGSAVMPRVENAYEGIGSGIGNAIPNAVNTINNSASAVKGYQQYSQASQIQKSVVTQMAANAREAEANADMAGLERDYLNSWSGRHVAVPLRAAGAQAAAMIGSGAAVGMAVKKPKDFKSGQGWTGRSFNQGKYSDFSDEYNYGR